MKRLSLAILLLPLCCFGQFNFFDQAFLGQAIFGPPPEVPQTIAGLAYWWHWTVLPTNVVVTNWIDRVQSYPFTNSLLSASPTNTENGVAFSHTGQSLTNPAPLQLSSNWTVWIGFVYTNLDPGGSFGMNAPLWGDNQIANDFTLGSTFQSTPKAQMNLIKPPTGAQQSFGLAAPYWLKFTDWVLVSSNNANGGSGNTWGYTNGTLAGNGGALPLFTNINNLGWNPQYNDGSTFLVGSIRDFLVYTNVLTPLNISNLHYWRTNSDLTSP